jgi:hypothetical protein
MALQTVVIMRKLLHVNIPFTKIMFLYALAQITIIVLVALRCIPKHSTTFQGTRLHSKGLDCIPRNATWTQINIFSKAYNLIY